MQSHAFQKTPSVLRSDISESLVVKWYFHFLKVVIFDE